jgi:hypothetical protein
MTRALKIAIAIALASGAARAETIYCTLAPGMNSVGVWCTGAEVVPLLERGKFDIVLDEFRKAPPRRKDLLWCLIETSRCRLLIR